MTKQEVIDGLKCHAGAGGCSECPYDKMFAINNKTCVEHLALDAINLLEEQEDAINLINLLEEQKNGVEPKISRQEDGSIWSYCGNCGYIIERGYQNYCSLCGTKIKGKKEND